MRRDRFIRREEFFVTCRDKRKRKKRKTRRKICNKDVAHLENHGGAERPDSVQEHLLGVKTWYSLKWSSEREGGVYVCKELVSCFMRVCMSKRVRGSK